MFWDNVTSGGFRQDKAEPLGSASVYWEFGLDLLKRKGLKRYGGETGIRTLDTLRYTRFPSVRLQPLGHLSSAARGNLLTLPQSARHALMWLLGVRAAAV
jgi:hypothetical protein